MTTIAYNHQERIIAADSRESSGSFIYSDNVVKMDVNEDGYWFIAGSEVDIDKIISAVGKPKRGRYPEVENVNSFSGFVCTKIGDVFEFQSIKGNLIVSKLDCNSAIGSGFDYATAAMDLGKSCGDAIRYAMTRDSATGGKVLIFDCETKEVLSHE